MDVVSALAGFTSRVKTFHFPAGSGTLAERGFTPVGHEIKDTNKHENNETNIETNHCFGNSDGSAPTQSPFGILVHLFSDELSTERRKTRSGATAKVRFRSKMELRKRF